MSAASLRTVPGKLGGDPGQEGDLLRLAVVVVKGKEPVATLKIVTDRSGQLGLERGKCRRLSFANLPRIVMRALTAFPPAAALASLLLNPLRTSLTSFCVRVGTAFLRP